MTVEELARAMGKDLGEPDNFTRKNTGTQNTWYIICNEIKAFKDENQLGGLKRREVIPLFFTLSYKS